MDLSCFSPEQLMVRESINKICSVFPDEYWAERDRTEEYPHELHAALSKDGWIGIALPEHLGGAGLGISEATMMLQTIAQSGAGLAGAQSIHANVYATQPVAKFASEEQKKRMLPRLIAGEWRTCFGVEHSWISSAQVAQKMILLARTTPVEEVKKPSEGLSLFFIDFDRAAPGLDLRKINKMGGRSVDANEVFFDEYRIPADSLIGNEGEGFKTVLHGMNAERCLLAGEALGLGYVALEKAAKYAKERVVFGRPIGQNQAIAHPLAAAYMSLEAAKLATYHATKLYDESRNDSSITQQSVGVACNSAKYLAAEAAFAACERARDTHSNMENPTDQSNNTIHRSSLLEEWAMPRNIMSSGICESVSSPESHPSAGISYTICEAEHPTREQEMIMNFISEKALGLPRSY
ncbi:uncharacterized protein ARB_01517 [Trichophyton benhamiae CBS 112371]|uniref:Acyl-CoA dehydrogenase n=1 Tax=Arthroderma benhamiae (strain ATCC MYA-4681 / CBS 112371) TaxID=663331 RepID=D4AZ97_ARTBC|nr:uncharacterized protein ARB_01517 [Trichophyton benhamiae CBS 112371]EFE31617.1 hypothetical protein ARB_01517 [Trichophyton benhamiae CBS 112371]